MHPLETTLYVVLALGIDLAGLYYTLSGIEPHGCTLAVAGMLVVGAIAMVRCTWIGGAHSREMRKIYKEINRKR